MKRIAFLADRACSFLLSLVAGSAVADEKVHAGAGVSVWVPDAWEMTADGDNMMVNTKDGLAVVFMVIAAKDLDAALEGADEALAASVKELTVVGEPQAQDINGLAAITVDGKGKIEGADVEVGLAIIDVPDPEKALIVVGIGTPDAIKANEADLGKIITSIKPAAK
jgi:hypothetical protein